MAVTWNRNTEPSSPIVADRNLYLDSSNNKVVEEGDSASASQLVAAGHPIDKADADRLGLVEKDGKIVQNREAKIGEHQKLVDDLEGEKKALYDSIEKYRKDHATKDIPNTMEAARVELEQRWEHAKMTLAQFVKAQRGMDPQKGESQATSLEPEKSPTARAATARAKKAVAASPTPQELGASAPSKKAESAPQRAAPVAPVAAKKAAAKKGRGK